MSEQATQNVPEKVITFTINGEQREVKMTYGLLNELISLIPDIDSAAKILIDTEVRNKALASVLATRSETGKKTSEVNVEDQDIDLEDIDNILSWASAHVTGFFIRSLTNMAKRVNALPQETLEQALAAAASTA